MTPALATSLPLTGTLLFYVLALAFWWPAWRWSRPAAQEDGLDRALRAALAWVHAFGVFSLASGPLLLAHASTDTAVAVLLPLWVLGVVAAEVRHRRRGDLLPAAEEGFSPDPPELHALPPAGLLLLVVALGGSLAYAFGALAPRPTFTVMGLSFLAGGALAWRGRSASNRVLGAPSPTWNRWILGLLLLLVIVALLTPAFHFRADADDNLYLSEALLLQDSEAMGKYAPTHRGEALPSNPIYAWQSFELWGALMARFSGLHPLIVLRSLCGPILLLAGLAVMAGLLRTFLPRAWIPTAMVFVLAYFLIGTSSQWTPNNYLLTRPQQGKTWLMHLGLVALVLHSLRFLRLPKAHAVPLLLTSFACLGWAPTAVLLVPALLGTLGFGMLLVRPQAETLRRALPLSLGLIPPVAFAAWLTTRRDTILEDETIGWIEGSQWTDLFFFQFLQGGHQGGGLEMLMLAASPLLLLALPHLRRQVFPLAFGAAALLIILNPLWFDLIRAYLSGEAGYVRFFWLLPFPLLLGAFGSAYVALALHDGTRWRRGAGALGCCLLAYPLCGGNYVWSEDNLYTQTEDGIYLDRVENPYKMPNGLLDVARALQDLPLGPDHRILCHLNVVMHLAPLVEAFDFVYARDFQTTPPLLVLGREEEASRREALGFDFLGDGMRDEEAAPLLEQESASYLVLDPETRVLRDQAARLGYSLRLESGAFSLWVRE